MSLHSGDVKSFLLTDDVAAWEDVRAYLVEHDAELPTRLIALRIGIDAVLGTYEMNRPDRKRPMRMTLPADLVMKWTADAPMRKRRWWQL